MGLAILLAAAIVAVTAMAVREVIAYRRTRPAYTLRRITLRLSMAIMLLFLLGSIYVGVYLFDLETPMGHVGPWIAFWGCIGMLAFGVLCLVIADVRALGDELRQTPNTLQQEIAAIIAEHTREHSPDQ